jgi:ribonuclease D
MIEATLVTDAGHLDSAVARLRNASRLAVDTEFMRERTYYPQLCLIQVASDADCYLVDPLAGLSLEPLFELLTDRGKLKILHAARQDLEVLLQTDPRGPHAALAVPVFDTQAAAALLGLAPQIGYAELVARRLGNSIDKGQTRTNWARRPLTPEQLAYAADDVRHLLELHADLERDLAHHGRAEWLREDMRAIECISLYRTDPADAWRRLKGLGRLRPRERVAGRELARWREERAIASDRPRGWILPDEALFAIATQLPATLDSLAAVRSVPPGTVRRHGEELLARVRNAQAEATDEEPARSGRPDPEVVALAARLMQVIRDEAARLEISPELLATRRDIDAIAQGEDSSNLLTGWRGQVVGDALRAVLSRRAASESA